MLNRLVGRAVFTQANRVMREHMDHTDFHQRGHADRIAAVIAEREEGAAVGDEAAVQGHAIHDGGHAELAHAVVDVAATLAGFVFNYRAGHGVKAQARRALGVGQVRAGQVGRAAQQLGQGRREGFQRQL